MSDYFDRLYNTPGRFTFHFPTKILFGAYCSKYIKELLISNGWKRAIVVSDRNISATEYVKKLIRRLKGTSLHVETFLDVETEPDVQAAMSLARTAIEAEADVIVAIGGGSVIDVCKLGSVLARKEWAIEELLRIDYVGEAVPIITVPTTAGSGSEVSRFCTLTNVAQKRKVSFRGWSYCARYAVIDPIMALTLGSRQTVLTGWDTFCHGYDVLTLKGEASSITDMMASEAMARVLEALPKVVNDSTDVEARLDLSYASMLGGVIISNTRTGLLHTMAEALGGRLGIVHGQALAVLFRTIHAFNYPHITHKLNIVEHAYGRASSGKRFDEGINRLYALLDAHELCCVPKSSLARIGDRETMVRELCNAVEQDQVIFKENPAELTMERVRFMFESVLQ